MKRFPRQEKNNIKRTIINVRGTNGSGKTTAVRKMLKMFGNTPLINDRDKVWAYQVHFEPEFYVLGRYVDPLDGCDRISTIEKVAEGVKTLSQKGNVLFEGILVSILTKPWIELAQSMPDAHFIFATLDTPSALCIKRVNKRRKSQGQSDDHDPKHLLMKYKAIHHAHSVLKKAGLDVRHLQHDYATQNLVNWFLEDTFGEEKK
jgi:pantothenate kinase